MKSKILFGALLGSIALASCNADEDLKSSVVRQESPIKFAVSLEAGNGVTPSTRAEITESMKLNFEAGDLMSLFHGIADPSSAFTGYQNAIYEGSAKDGEAFVFTTKSMVLAKGAIMVYPADTAFTNAGTAAPNLTIPANQTPKTKSLMPYMSEILNIEAYDDDSEENTAGYDKKYDIILKQVGSTLSLTTVPSNTDKIDNLGVSKLRVSNIKMNATGAFTTSVPVKHTADTPAKNTDYPLWVNVSDVDVTTATKGGALTTNDITDNYKAVFTLLPSADNISVTGATININTNYGTVTLNDNTGDIWGKTTATVTYNKTVSAGIQDVLQNTWIENTTASSTFVGEKTGGSFKRSIKADMSTLDMNGLLIRNEKHLIDALKVYDAIASGKTVTFNLAGDESKEFVMNAEAAAAYQARIADAENKITFSLSTEALSKCEAVKFVSTTETEIPAVLTFGSDDASVKFAGMWKYSKGDKKFTKVTSLVMVEESELTMTGTVGVATGGSLSTPAIISNGMVEISGATTLKLTMTNNGTINIPVGAEFLMNGGTLTNDATTLSEYGKIDNAGSLGVQNGTNGKINNYGYITQKNEDAYTYVSTNADANADFADAFSDADNRIGTIQLFGTGNLNTTIGANGEDGFIKVITSAASVTDKEVGSYANYVEITGAKECKSLPATILYVEVKSPTRVIWTATDVTVTGLIVDEGFSLNIPRGSKVTSTTTYVKGRIYNAGTFTSTDFDGYLGGAAADAKNIIVSE